MSRLWVFKGAAVGLIAAATIAAGGTMLDAQEEKMDINAPGPMHEHLASLAGKWKLTIKITPVPGAPPVEGTIDSNHEMIYGGRFLRISGSAEIGGSRGEAITILGHNNLTGKFSLYSIAEISTDATWAEGELRGEPPMIVLHGSNLDPTTAEPQDFRIEIGVCKHGHYHQSNFFKAGTPNEYKGVEISGTRG